ncbi:AAA family ATPase [Brevundimonas sp.]|uniref:AAA family ATPase n=1 Tax=Brevundimonas sp. TaxID=1871086 RepID=UPI002D575090|nr:AAA family ATPase [Brevundimonas sp.]HYC74896.1 AAA family ATPase [Brevundimonas sp.]
MTTLIVLYGPPAVGKLTVARRLAERTGFRLFHNHLTVDLALSLFDFGTPGFRDLRAAVWRTAFEAAFAAGIDGLIFTFTPEPSVDSGFIPGLLDQARRAGGRTLLVELTAPAEVLKARIGTQSRRDTGKLTDPVLFADLLDKGVFATGGMPPPSLAVDTSQYSPAGAVDQIAQAL